MQAADETGNASNSKNRNRRRKMEADFIVGLISDGNVVVISVNDC